MNIKAIIKSKGFTIQEVADKIGVNRVTLTLTLQGNPTYKKMKEIAEAIDCDVMDFFKDEAVHQPGKEARDLNSLACPNCGAKLELKIKE